MKSLGTTEYKDFAELSKFENEGIDYKRQVIFRGSRIAIIAPHGGGIEPGTSEIATALANETFSLYTFDGIKRSGNSVLHITSVSFDDPVCLKLVEASDIIVTIHGCAGKTELVHIGGLSQELMALVSNSLSKSGFNVNLESKDYPGENSKNICNRGLSGKGLQIEINEGLRQQMFKGLRQRERKITTLVFERFVSAIRDVLNAEDSKTYTYSDFPGPDQ